MRLIFVRHGEPDYAKDCLTGTGRVQAECTAKRLHDEKIEAIYSSPMGRAKETASYTAHDHGLDINVLDFMHEINWGAKENAEGLKYNGHPWTLASEFRSDTATGKTDLPWKEHPYFRDNVCMDYFTLIGSGIDALFEKYGIVRENGMYRSKNGFDGTIALFAHGGSGAVMFSYVLDLPFPFVLTSMPYGVCSVSIVNFETQPSGIAIPRIELFNDMRHLPVVATEKLHFEK
ncbi:MAG: histidine phosphatase family protein [Lachnospiraceae bacterium]|nr:histidine phosphatase family protein [Lachnospiraceae bacterium]